MVNKIYVILTSWNDVLYRVEAWSTNYYFIKLYYEHYVELHPEAMMLEYETHDKYKITSLVRMVGLDYGIVGLEDFVSSELKLCTSLDDKLNVIYKSAYDCSFKTKSYYMDSWLYGEITSIIAEIFLSVAPLLKFVYSDIDLLELVFKAYSYTSKVSKNTELDMVYMWYLMLRMSNSRFYRYNCISDYHQSIIPINSVFVNND